MSSEPPRSFSHSSTVCCSKPIVTKSRGSFKGLLLHAIPPAQGPWQRRLSMLKRVTGPVLLSPSVSSVFIRCVCVCVPRCDTLYNVCTHSSERSKDIISRGAHTHKHTNTQATYTPYLCCSWYFSSRRVFWGNGAVRVFVEACSSTNMHEPCAAATRDK